MTDHAPGINSCELFNDISLFRSFFYFVIPLFAGASLFNLFKQLFEFNATIRDGFLNRADFVGEARALKADVR
jgi:hypothetical protein